MVKFLSIFRIFEVFTVFHLLFYALSKRDVRDLIDSDVVEMNKRTHQHKSLSYYLLWKRPYRNLFYYRVGKIKTFPLRLILWSYPMFFINAKSIGKNAFVLNHPYGTIINSGPIGSHFTCCQLNTIGNKQHGHNDLVATLGDHVSMGANATIIGKVIIGNNVVIGAGAVVTKDIPDNSIVAGNPAKVIKTLKPA